jgi:hypothetical protein
MEDVKKAKEVFTIKGDWAAQSKAMKVTFSQLTDADLKWEKGREEELIKRLMNKLGKKRDEIVYLLKRGMSAKVL